MRPMAVKPECGQIHSLNVSGVRSSRHAWIAPDCVGAPLSSCRQLSSTPRRGTKNLKDFTVEMQKPKPGPAA